MLSTRHVDIVPHPAPAARGPGSLLWSQPRTGAPSSGLHTPGERKGRDARSGGKRGAAGKTRGRKNPENPGAWKFPKVKEGGPRVGNCLLVPPGGGGPASP